MAQHARLSASGSERWAECPGSVALEMEQPEALRGSSVYADEGTAAHAVLERCLTKAHPPARLLGRWVRVLPDGGTSILPEASRPPAGSGPHSGWFEVDADMAEAVAVCYDHVVSRVRAEVPDLAETDDRDLLCRALARGIVRAETRVHFLPELEGDAFGTCDVRLDFWPTLEVVDYKHGRGVPVRAEGNRQLRCYALGALMLPENRDAGYEDVVITVVQPRCREVEPVQTWATTARHLLEEFRPEMLGRAADVERAIATRADVMDETDAASWEGEWLNPGKHCRFCDAAHACPAKRRLVSELAGADFAADPVALSPPASVEELARMLRWVPSIDAWLRTLERAGEALLLSGERVPGYKLVRKKTNRRWKADATLDAVKRHLVGEGWLPEERAGELVTEPQLKTGPQVEKLIPKEHRREFEELFLEKPEGALTMAPDNDPRPAVDPPSSAAALDFEGVED